MPEQKITVEEALRAYTVGAAYASFDESRKGTLAAGKLADLVVLDRDLFNIPAEEIRNAKVVATVVGGKVVSGSWPARRLRSHVVSQGAFGSRLPNPVVILTSRQTSGACARGGLPSVARTVALLRLPRARRRSKLGPRRGGPRI